MLVLVFAVTCWVEKVLSPKSESVFNLWAHSFAILPGFPGGFLRRAFYSLSLENCSLNIHVGFGSIFTHRSAVVEDHVSIGSYAIIGSAQIGRRCEIGSRVSITSGKHQHVKDREGRWTPFSPTRLVQVKIGSDVWVGEGAIIMADVGQGSLVGAGSVVASEVNPRSLVGGNPAHLIRMLESG
jgi:virginiamycin A acetyltransferase